MPNSDLEKASHNDGAHSVVAADDSAHIGVQRVEATHRVFGKYSKWVLFVSLGLAAYVYSLDGTTTYYYLQFATSELNGHSLLTTVAVVQAMIIACGKPIIAKVSDVTSRGYAFVVVLFSYVIGYIIIASAKSVAAVAAGIVFYAMGYTGLQVLNSIIIADITTLKWRGLVSGLMSLPFVINAFVAANIQADILSKSGWRWGYGMFAILIPAAISPLIVTLVWAERKAKRLGFAPPVKVAEGSVGQRTWGLFQKLDLPGLFLLGAGVTLLLLPMTLAARALNGWGNGGMIAMVVLGILLLPAFAVYEWKVATFPVIPSRFLKNRAVTVAAAIGFFDFVSFYLTWAYLNSFVYVVKHDWSAVNLSYFANTQTVALTVFGILAGFIMRFTGRYKYIQIFGLCVRLIGVGIMIHSRGANGNDAELVMSQIIQGFGGGFAAITSQVGAQASVPHVDVATVTAFVLLVTEIGGAVGNAIAGGIWSNLMPGKLAQQLAPQGLNQTEIDGIYNSIVVAATYPDGDPIRQGVINAYGDVMHIMLIVAIVVAVIPIVLTVLMPNYQLGDFQNAVDQKKLSGDTDSMDSRDHVTDEKRAGDEHGVDRT